MQMDPQKQKQFINQMYQSSAKSEEELSKMTPEERREYLAGRLKQKMFFSSAQRQSQVQKKQLQEKMQSKLEENKSGEQEQSSNKTEKNRKKNQKRREKLRAMKQETQSTKPKESKDGSESDYVSDNDE